MAEPYAYLKDVLERLPMSTPEANQLHAPLPHNWQHNAWSLTSGVVSSLTSI